MALCGPQTLSPETLGVTLTLEVVSLSRWVKHVLCVTWCLATVFSSSVHTSPTPRSCIIAKSFVAVCRSSALESVTSVTCHFRTGLYFVFPNRC